MATNRSVPSSRALSHALPRGEVTTDLTDMTGGYFPSRVSRALCRDGHHSASGQDQHPSRITRSMAAVTVSS